MFLNGHIYRGKKPVHWSPSSMTALAEAELEYPEGHTSQSVYVAFPVKSVSDAFPLEFKEELASASFAVWTTTPWTMPANAAVAVNEALEYSLVKVVGEVVVGDVADASDDVSDAFNSSDASKFIGKKLVVATGLVAEVAQKLKVTLETITTVTGAQLEGCTYGYVLRVSQIPASLFAHTRR